MPVPLREMRYCNPLGRVIVPGLAALLARKAVLAAALKASSAARAANDTPSNSIKATEIFLIIL